VWRRFVSFGGNTFARVVLALQPHDLTGAFKAWRRATLAAIPWHAVHSGGYVFMIETTYLASRSGARIVEVPITFVDRRAGQSKMSRRIIAEAFVVVLTLRWDELRGRAPFSRSTSAR
jgi:dolichol-phosphate mannosyltransferase